MTQSPPVLAPARLTERLGDMAVYAAVVAAGGFTAAARELGLSKGAVSKAVLRLERHLDTRLLTRSTRHVAPTEAGEALLAYCTAIVHQADAAERHLGQLREEPQGLLRMTAPLSFGIACVAPLLPELERRHPRLEVALHVDDAVVDLVGERIDLALRVGPLPDSGLVARRIAVIGASIVASPLYLEAHGEPAGAPDLRRHRCLRYGEHDLHWRLRDGDVAIGRGPAINSTLAQLQAVLHGGGLALLPDHLSASHVAAGRLRRVLPALAPSPRELFALHPYARHVPAKVVAAISFFAERLAGAG